MGNAWFCARFLARSRRCSGQVLGCSWASWSAFGRLLGCLGRLLGFLGRLLGRLGRSWETLGLSWAVLGGSWTLLGSLGQLLCALGRLLERSWAPSWRQVGRQEAQSRPQDPPKWRSRRSKIALICKTIFRTPFWELRDEFWRPFSPMLGRPGAQKSLKNL